MTAAYDPGPEPELITSREAAKILGYKESYVRKLLRKGKLHGGRIGRDWILLSSDVHSFEKPKRGRPQTERRAYVKHDAQYWAQFKGGTE